MAKLSSAKKLSKTEQYAIEGMSDNGMSAEYIAQALGAKLEVVSGSMWMGRGGRGGERAEKRKGKREEGRGKSSRESGHPNIHSKKSNGKK